MRAQTRTDSSRSFDSHSSSTISSIDAVVGGGGRPAPPPVALKPTVGRPNQAAEPEQSSGREDEEDPSNKSFLGKVTVLQIQPLKGPVRQFRLNVRVSHLVEH